jgi:hypothetical protein
MLRSLKFLQYNSSHLQVTWCIGKSNVPIEKQIEGAKSMLLGALPPRLAFPRSVKTFARKRPFGKQKVALRRVVKLAENIPYNFSYLDNSLGP